MELIHCAAKLNGHVACRSCITKWVRENGRDLFRRPAVEDDILPAEEYNNVIKSFVKEHNISTIEAPAV